MTARIAETLEPKGILGANVSMGYYIYGAPNQVMGPEFPPACIVEMTRGDRRSVHSTLGCYSLLCCVNLRIGVHDVRLGTHVQSGIELLLPFLLDEHKLDPEALKAVFPEARRALSEKELIETAQFMTDHLLGIEFAAQGILPEGAHGLDFQNTPRDETSLANGAAFPLPLTIPVDAPLQWTSEGSRHMTPEWSELWEKTTDELRERLEAAGGGEAVLSYLYSRMGHDCGRFIGELHKLKISWGTYQDEMCFDGQWHCNAHANNMVLLAEGESQDMFLSYLDLDMAFDSETFVECWGKTAPKGTVGQDPEAFAKLLRREHVNFMEVLAGADSTSGVPQVAMHVVEAHCEATKLVKSLLYDTLILGYLRGYTGEEHYPVMEVDPVLHAAAYSVCKLAVMVMADYVA